jgi:FlaA1/EpsC-like NDP-sugar epimerase
VWKRSVESRYCETWTTTAARRVSRFDLPRRVGARIALDSAALVAGLVAAQMGRYDFDPDTVTDPGFWMIVGIAVCLLHFLGTALHLYLGRYRFGSFEEVFGIGVSVALTALGLLILDVAFGSPRPLPLSVPPLGGAVTIVVMLGTRYLWRLAEGRRRRPTPDNAEPIVVFGAGAGGERVLAAMLGTPTSPYYPVALLDDDPVTWNLRLCGVPVRGGRDAIGAVAASTGASTLLVAIPSADAVLLREVSAVAEAAGMAVKVLPKVADLIDGRVGVGDIRDLDLADVLGRRQIETDVEAAAGYLCGRRVLVTGAGGSIGSELCRQIHRYDPAELIMVDRDETALRATELSMHGRPALDRGLVLGDIRDVGFVMALFDERRPHVVFHAAALKHLPLLERYPGEAVKTNVWGTLSLLEAAAAHGVECFVNISTDKAANPVCALGHSKRVTERLTAHAAAACAGRFASVRFGNVLGSNGSVLTVFASQLASGGPLTVTHPDVTRFFMTIPEAVQLVIQAGAIGGGGDALVLDMGQPVRIIDVAHRLAARAPRPVEIVFTGLGAGEKLHEELFGAFELDVRPHHPLISEVPVPPLDPARVVDVDPWADAEQVRSVLASLCRRDDLAEDSHADVAPTVVEIEADVDVIDDDDVSVIQTPGVVPRQAGGAETAAIPAPEPNRRRRRRR